MIGPRIKMLGAGGGGGTWVGYTVPAPDFSFLLMHTLGNSGGSSSGRVPATHMEHLDGGPTPCFCLRSTPGGCGLALGQGGSRPSAAAALQLMLYGSIQKVCWTAVKTTFAD